jgi:hypothetical protein
MRRSWLLLLLVGSGCAQHDPATASDPPESGAQEPVTLTRVIAVAADGTQIETRATVDRGRMAGRYFTGDGTGYNLRLDLRADGSFDMTWTGCLGVYGTASGTWAMDERGIALNATQADGLFATRPLGRLLVASLDRHYLLVDESFRDLFDKYGPSHASCLHQKAAEAPVEAAHARAIDNAVRRVVNPTGPSGAAAEPGPEPHQAGGKWV